MSTKGRMTSQTPSNAVRNYAITKLEETLKKDYQNNVLIPISVGDKRPIVPFAGGSWTWEKYDAYKRRDDDDWAILASDLIVIDIDNSEDLVAFKILFEKNHWLSRRVHERTTKGVHYYFKRTPLCEELGLYNSNKSVTV